ASPCQQVHRDLRELQRRAALQEQHLVVVRDRQELAQVLFRLRRDRHEFLAAMAHLHHAHAGAAPVEHFVAGARQDFLGQDRRPRAEIKNSGHQWRVGPSGAGSAGGSTASPVPPLPPFPPLPSSSSRSRIRSTPASFSPSDSAISVTPCVERPLSRICATAGRISTPPVEISITSSWSSTSTAPTSAPLPSLAWMAIMPWPPRPCLVYSAIGVRLPKPFSVAVSTVSDSSFAASMHTTRRLLSS